MYQYKDGSDMQIGDHVLIEDGQTKGTIKQLVVTKEEQQQCSVPTGGVMVLAPPYGNVFLPEFTLTNNPIDFVKRRVQH